MWIIFYEHPNDIKIMGSNICGVFETQEKAMERINLLVECWEKAEWDEDRSTMTLNGKDFIYLEERKEWFHDEIHYDEEYYYGKEGEGR